MLGSIASAPGFPALFGDFPATTAESDFSPPCIIGVRLLIQMWLSSLRRRSQRHNMPWERMNRIIDAWIPPAVIRHPWPSQRFDVKHPRQEPSALAAHARICAGGAA